MPALIYELFLEGEFACTEKDGTYVYALTMDEEATQNLAEMIAPEIVSQVVTLTSGNLYVTLEDEQIASIEVDIDGTVKMLFVEVGASIGAIFEFE